MKNEAIFLDGIVAIKLNDEHWALVDADDYTLVAPYKWYAVQDGHNIYAATNIRKGNKYTNKRMHRLILDAKKGEIVDHINRDGTDNRRQNLRIVNRAQNRMNASKYSNGASNYKGVTFDKRYNKYRAQIKTNGKSKHIGYYDTEEEAALAYNRAAQELFDEYAYLNEIKTTKQDQYGNFKSLQSSGRKCA